ncbi:double-strand break repair helicase AddA [Afifella sp. IM 167]|uniref:double-strand break repair helicase AddA n=1 Tax=Afifella sp. IM 167 TaxID=2033586 RepID=UPI001CC90494|nr:double-strand break repair helicase AddA [Afifella sp. IM 167]MBZ8133610.1 double-strand break repair helicase AddA [Afifella sp. IM 167]
MTDLLASPTARLQWQASDPEISAFVAANAGSGKTHVLTQRVVRLLLAGADPGSILCLTYTKAAAAEMSGRVFRTLGEWAVLPDAELAVAIAGSQGFMPDRAAMGRARRLFARALETPGGLNIQTIHAFCERILHQFPFEANVPGHFEVLDETGAEALLARARQAVLARAEGDQEGLGAALAKIATLKGDQEIEGALKAVIDERDALERWMGMTSSDPATPAGTVADIIRDLRQRLELSAQESEEAIRAEICASPGWDGAEGEELYDLLGTLGDLTKRNDIAARDAMEALLAEIGQEREADLRLDFFLTQREGRWSPRSEKHRFGKVLRESYPDLDERFLEEALRLAWLRERLSLVRTAEATAALFIVGDAILQRYKHLKQRRGFLDFTDLILRTRNLLKRGEVAAWVQYKLDAGINHILVDEAQDTSPDAWEIVRMLAAEFFAGKGAERGIRTLFAVGDDKQSIYGFQGADPALLAENSRSFASQAEAAAMAFRQVPLGVSFRSVQAVLDAVDTVFDGGLSTAVTSLGYERHQAFREKAPGEVRLLPRIVRPKGEEPESWTAPFDAPTQSEHRLAEEIAEEIARLLRQGRLPSGAKVRPGGIMVLSRKRGSFARAMVRALKARGLPTAGADRIALADHIIAEDLLALADVVLLPEDDLQLAALLKSPLFGFDDDDLMALLIGRGRASLMERLQASERAKHNEAHERLRGLMALADRLTPFAFFTRLIETEGGREKFRARMGSEADDVLDLFLSTALSLEQVAAPGLQALAATIRAGAGDVKRELSEGAETIRVMTVHGAKGLEADIVFLADTGGQISVHQHRDRLVKIGTREAPAFLWRQSKEDAAPAQLIREAEEKAEAENEYFRLLYVAMTRAKDLLVVCGIRGERSPKNAWYATIAEALAPDAERGEDGELLAPFCWHGESPQPHGEAAAEEVQPAKAETVLPDWALRPAKPARLPPQPLRPSSALAEEDPPPGPATAMAAMKDAARLAAGRGRALHKLLQFLPDWPEAERAMRAERLLARIWPEADGAARAKAFAEALSVLGQAELAPLFTGESRAEVSLVGEIETKGGAFAIGGRIDRLAVGEAEVFLADYKTGAPPASLASADETALRQIALYAALLRHIYPQKKVRAALVYTAGPTVIEVPQERLEAALASLGIGADASA